MSAPLVYENPVFRSLAFHAVICMVKMFLMAPFTTLMRFRKKAFANPEDVRGMKKDGKYLTPSTDDDVERVKRGHLNDLENIVPFVVLGLLYALTDPAPSVARAHFSVYSVSRLLHTVAYQVPLRQPARVITFSIGFLVNLSMAVQIFLYVW